MSFEEQGERIKDLQLIMQRVAFAATLFDDDGIDIRFMNDEEIPLNALSGIRSEQQIGQVLNNKKYKGLTPFGTKLREKVIDGIVLPKLRQPRKPILVIGITDGQPAGENQNALSETIRYAASQTQQLGPGAIAFEFAQVGNDEKATQFLARLDNDPQVGRMVDCTSSKFAIASMFQKIVLLTSTRLRERVCRDVSRSTSRRPHARPLDAQAHPRCHRPELRYQRREV